MFIHFPLILQHFKATLKRQGVLCEYGHAIGAYPGAARRCEQDCVLLLLSISLDLQGVLCEYGHAIGPYPCAARRSGQDCVLGPPLCHRNQKRGQSNKSLAAPG